VVFSLVLLVLSVLGVPLSWHKVKAGFILNWIGLEVDVREYRLGISERRAAWLLGSYDKVLSSGVVSMTELRQALGRMVFVYGALSFDKPFLAPLFSFMYGGVDGGKGRLPKFVRATLAWLRESPGEKNAQLCY
jgi:hypothetical protein